MITKLTKQCDIFPCNFSSVKIQQLNLAKRKRKRLHEWTLLLHVLMYVNSVEGSLQHVCLRCTGVVRACTDGAANILYDCQSNDMLLPTLISGDFDSLRCDVLNYYDNVVKVSHSVFTV